MNCRYRQLLLAAMLFFVQGSVVLPLQAAPVAKKQNLVLMPLRLSGDETSMRATMETGLVGALQKKYEVFSGERVQKKAREIFNRESSAATKECDETKCMQGIAQAFNASLIATANISQRKDGYFLALSIQDIVDNKVVYSESIPCRNCDAFEVMDKIPELVGISSEKETPIQIERVKPSSASTAEEDALWKAIDLNPNIKDYQMYITDYPSGKYIALAKTRISKIEKQEKDAAEKIEKDAWAVAQKEHTEEAYLRFIDKYPSGRYTSAASSRIEKLKAEAAERVEKQFWQTTQQQNSESSYTQYLAQYPNGRFVEEAKSSVAKLKAAAEALRDKQAWEQAQQINTKDSYGSYLAGFPAGRYVEEAKKAQAAAADQAEIQSWETAQVQDTVKSYTAYLNAYPNGRFVEQANTALVEAKKPASQKAAEKAARQFVADLGFITLPGKSWRIMQNELTFAQWDQCVAAKGCNGYKPADEGWGRGNQPVIYVSYDDIQSYIAWANKKTGYKFRLPKEDEWEFAARGGKSSHYWWGDNIGRNNAVCETCGSRWDNKQAAPVGSFKANPYGLYDTAGNVWEWTETCREDECETRVVRGGSWYVAAASLRVGYRYYRAPDYRSNSYGFRLLLD